jgi:hypothetical protein
MLLLTQPNDLDACLPLFVCLRDLRRWIERRMEALPAAFKSAVGRGRLLLHAWRRGKDLPPYAVYRVLVNRRRRIGSSWESAEPRFPFRRLKIHTRQDLDDAVWHGLLSRNRRQVYGQH